MPLTLATLFSPLATRYRAQLARLFAHQVARPHAVVAAQAQPSVPCADPLSENGQNRFAHRKDTGPLDWNQTDEL